ncbi:tumor protein D54-like isoform X3 [Betta splendens]|uniref:Tumor protein D54-like isoform X3 n=1 Tax=Betta splendens TaxID=158456 RepID=A0A6P7N3M6_BETSP|nr:tumor protein D54-like isoform X3 [Betta splendens]
MRACDNSLSEQRSSLLASHLSSWRQAATSCCEQCEANMAAMNRPGFVGASTSMNFSRITRNGSSPFPDECSPSDLTEEDIDNLRTELAKMEDEIQTLRQVLLAKEQYAAEIRRQLGMSPLSNVKQNLCRGWQDVQTSTPYLTASATLDDIKHSSVYMRTQEILSHAGHVTSSALSNVGVGITRRLAEMSRLNHTISVPSMRHSSTFRSFEGMASNVKDRVTGGMTNNGDTAGFDRRFARHST